MRPRITATLPAPCVDCGGAVTPDDEWQVGHVVGVDEAKALGWTPTQIDAPTNLGPSHRKCNASAGGKLGAAKVNARRAAPTREAKGLPDWHRSARPKAKRATPRAIKRQVFEKSPLLSPDGSRTSLSGPKEFRDSGISPKFVASTEGSRQFRGEFLSGARALRLDTPRKPIHPQQFMVGDVLNAVGDDGLSLHSVIGICIPRRATKTTSIFATLVGRCLERDDYQVAYAAQSGTKGRDRFLKDLVPHLERMYPDIATRPFKINRSRGGEHIAFDNGSRFAILPPQPESFRGDAWNVVVLDEAQEHDPELGAELKAAILPTFDTVPGAQLIIAGTTGEHRSGILWQTLEDGRNGKAATGIVEYAAPDDTPVYDPEIHETIDGTTADPEIWKLAHPGIDTLTSLKIIGERYEALTPEAFAREYLGIWPKGSESRFISPVQWDLCGLPNDEMPALPDRFTTAFAVHPSGTYASIVAAWREEGVAQILVLEHGLRTSWLASSVKAITTEYTDTRTRFRLPVAHDTVGAAIAEAEALARQRPAPNLKPQKWANVASAATLLLKEIEAGNLRHWNQPVLNDAIGITTKRGTPRSNLWAFNATDPEGDITTVNAAAMALRAYDEEPVKRRAVMPTSMRS